VVNIGAVNDMDRDIAESRERRKWQSKVRDRLGEVLIGSGLAGAIIGGILVELLRKWM
jgi:hypothetical protein